MASLLKAQHNKYMIIRWNGGYHMFHIPSAPCIEDLLPFGSLCDIHGALR